MRLATVKPLLLAAAVALMAALLAGRARSDEFAADAPSPTKDSTSLDELIEQISVAPIYFELSIPIRQSGVCRASAHDRIQLSSPEIFKCGSCLSRGGASAAKIFSRDRDFLLQHCSLVHERVRRNAHRTLDPEISARAQIFPGSCLGNARLHHFPFCPRCLHRRVVAQHDGDQLALGEAPIEKTKIVSRLFSSGD